MRRLIAVVGVVAMLIGVGTTGVAVAEDGTGGPSAEWLAQQSSRHVSMEDDKQQLLQKLTEDRQYTEGRALKQGDVRAQVGEPDAYYMITRNIPQTPVANDNRGCVHCGAASTWIALRALRTTYQIDQDDFGAFTDPWGIKRLADGYFYGNNSSYAITVPSGNGWGGDQWRMKTNLNLRSTRNYYLSNSINITRSQLSSILKTTVYSDKPVIFLINTSPLRYYQGHSLAHYIVADGYSNGGYYHRVNDPNNCSSRAGELGFFGYHTVTQDESMPALDSISEGKSNILW